MCGDRRYPAFQEYSVLRDISKVRVIENKEKLPWSVYLGVCGMPGEIQPSQLVLIGCQCARLALGQTAHHGWEEVSHAKKV